MTERKKLFRFKRGYKALFLLFTICVGVDGMAAEVVTVESVADQNLVYNTPVELHITNTANAVVNSTISLDHQDAWVFFDNIAPSEVIENYLQFFRINGNAFVNESNGRVAIYGHGSVLIPHRSDFEPLTLYSEDNFQGDSMKFYSFRFYNGLREFDKRAASLRLKRGYMATLASDPDGKGYSRVFIADKEDIIIPELQPELYQNTSFVRVFKYEWVNKKAKAGWNPHDLDATSYYDWNIGGNSSSDVEYVAIRQNAGWPSWSAIKEKRGISHLLGFNEPDRPDQANMTFNQMIDLWPEMMTTGLRIGSPAWSNAWGGSDGNLFDFIEKCDALNYRVDFVAVHAYWGGKSPANWYNDLKTIHDLTGRPLWITEWNNGANWTTEWWPDSDRSYTPANAEKQLNNLKGILQVMDTASFIERYFIYDWVQDCRAMVLNGELTLAGEYYASNPSQIGYNSDLEVIPPAWNYEAPALHYQYLSLSNKISLRFTDVNGNMNRGFKVEKRVNNGSYETLYESDDITVTAITDDLDSLNSGSITYRLSIKTVYDTYIYSNEVSYYQSAGSATLQTGIFPFSNTAWNTALFSRKFETDPAVIAGIPSFNNIYGLTWGTADISANKFKFRFDTWDYLGDPALTKTDHVAVLAMPEGLYAFNGLKAEVAHADQVNYLWDTVTFEQTFETVPAVFCTKATATSYIPVTPVIRNVTKTGFEVCLKAEEKNNIALVRSEKINFLAIETGQGAIDDFRISVGRPGEGIAGDPVTIAYDSSYTVPAIFAGLQSARDDFATTLRYMHDDHFEFEVRKQRELSGQLVAMQQDTLAYMIIDLGSGQIIQHHETHPVPEMLSVYPNPANEYIRVALRAPAEIRIFDLCGRELIRKKVADVIDLDGLEPGTYFLKTEGFRSVMFVKQ